MTDCACRGGSRHLLLAVASQSLAFVRAIARDKTMRQPALRAASRVGGVYWGVGMLGDGVVSLGGLEDSIFKGQAESSKIVRSEQPFFIKTSFLVKWLSSKFVK
jgi:hypothetical protein